MQPFSAFGYLFTGLIVGLIVGFLSCIFTGIYQESRRYAREYKELQLELVRIRHQEMMEQLKGIYPRLLKLFKEDEYMTSFPVKEPEKPLQSLGNLPYTE